MKRVNAQIVFTLIILTLIFANCSKREWSRRDTDCSSCDLTRILANDSLIGKANTYFDKRYGTDASGTTTNSVNAANNPRLNGARRLLWNKATVFNDGHMKAVVVPVSYDQPFLIQGNFSGRTFYNIDALSRVVVFPDSAGHWQSVWLSFLPDSNYVPGGAFSGIALEEDWDGNRLDQLRFDANGKIFRGTDQQVVAGKTVSNAAPVDNTQVTIVQTCYTIQGYNYTVNNPGETYSWSEALGCTYSSLITQGDNTPGTILPPITVGAVAGGASSGGTGISAAQTVIVFNGNNIIADINDYDKCFTNVAGNGHTYLVTVCVSQPVPGSRTTWGLSASGAASSSYGGNPINVGHSFLIFTESSGSSVIKRNIGLYPQGAVSPVSPVSPGQMNDDDQHSYNIALTITVTNSQFFSMLNYVAQNSTDTYNLNSFNCTSFVLNTLVAGSINLPRTVGVWTGGAGYDPGDLGEDIRALTLSSNMSRTTTYSSHPNLGTCN